MGGGHFHYSTRDGANFKDVDIANIDIATCRRDEVTFPDVIQDIEADAFFFFLNGLPSPVSYGPNSSHV